MRRWIAIGVVVLAVVGVFVWTRGGDEKSSRRPTTSALLDGSPSILDSTLESLRGKPVVVNFWATWCGPCKEEMPRLVEAANTYEGRVHFLGVDVEDDNASAADFIERYEIPFRSLSDPDGKIRRAERLLGLPATHFYDADGKLAFVKNGEISTGELDQKIRAVLAG